MEMIRKAKKEDMSRILRLFNSETYLIGNDNLRYKKNHIEEYVTNPMHQLFVYEHNKKVVGILLAEFYRKAKYFYITDIIVDKRYRREGIGSKIYRYIEKLAKKQKMELGFLFSEVSNKPMHKMAKKFGYEKGKKFYFFSKELK